MTAGKSGSEARLVATHPSRMLFGCGARRVVTGWIDVKSKNPRWDDRQQTHPETRGPAQYQFRAHLPIKRYGLNKFGFLWLSLHSTSLAHELLPFIPHPTGNVQWNQKHQGTQTKGGTQMEGFGFEGLNEMFSALNSAFGDGSAFAGFDAFALVAVFVAGIIAILIGL